MEVILESKPISMPGAWSNDSPSMSAAVPSRSSKGSDLCPGHLQLCGKRSLVESEQLVELVFGGGELLLELGGCDRFDFEVVLELGRRLHALFDQELDDGRR